MMNLVFIAPPAAGKGTFSTMLKNDFGYEHISAGDLLRNIDASSSVYDEVQKLLKEGNLVPTPVISALLKEKLLSNGSVKDLDVLLTMNDDEHSAPLDIRDNYSKKYC